MSWSSAILKMSSRKSSNALFIGLGTQTLTTLLAKSSKRCDASTPVISLSSTVQALITSEALINDSLFKLSFLDLDRKMIFSDLRTISS